MLHLVYQGENMSYIAGESLSGYSQRMKNERKALKELSERVRADPALGRKMLIGAGICIEKEDGSIELHPRYRPGNSLQTGLPLEE